MPHPHNTHAHKHTHAVRAALGAVVYAHGWPSSALEAAAAASPAAAAEGLTLVAWDRPGVGGSDGVGRE